MPEESWRRTAGEPAKRVRRPAKKATTPHPPLPPRAVRNAGKPTSRPKPRKALPPRVAPPAKLGNPQRRLRFGLAIILLFFGVLGGRLVQLQVTHGSAWAAQAFEVRTVRQDIDAPRGSIVDRNGKPLAHSVPATAISADPTFVKDPDGTASKLAGLLGVPQSDLSTKLSRKKNDKGGTIRFVYLARSLDPEVGQAVNALELPGIYTLAEQRRDVPGHDLAANIIGFTGIDGDGLGGLEASFDDVLKGKDGRREFEVGARGQEIPDGYHKQVEARPGQDVQLTIDASLQFQTQKILAETLRDKDALMGAAIVMDVKTGEILSMASYPTYDAANPGASDSKDRVDIATSAVVEPGSVHKAITFAAGMEEGVINKNSVLTIGPTIEKGGETFRDTHWHDTTGMTVPGMLAQSSNVGTITIADKLGADRLYEYQQKFGLGDSCETGIATESPGIVQPPKNWSGPSHGGIPIGLGVAVTPLQMTGVYATLGNGGKKVTPSLVKGTVKDGELDKRSARGNAGDQVISKDNAKALLESMEAVVSDEGTAPTAAVPGYRVAGKTGTGQRVIDDKYAPGDVTSFIGVVPADEPRYAIGFFAHVPTGTSGSVAGPAFSDLASFTLRHYGVAPTGTDPPPFQVYA
ncbi:MAG: penicillin-binding protein 2 [Corynebacteriales bacterium]|nr:penicillin-binding protein 2 [Mycobacteriales bacterium]